MMTLCLVKGLTFCHTFLQESCWAVDQLHGGVLTTRSGTEAALPCRPCINIHRCHGKPIQQVRGDAYRPVYSYNKLVLCPNVTLDI